MKKSRYLISICIVALLISLFNPNYIQAQTNAIPTSVIQQIANALNYDVDLINYVSLYDNTDDVVAICYDVLPKGYIIVDKDTYGVIEYSPQTLNPFNFRNKKNYYGGPLSYYYEENNVIKSYKDNTIINKNKIVLKHLTSEVKNSINEARVGPYVGYLEYSTRPYNTNVGKKRCGATAAAILITYYYDHIDSRFALPGNILPEGDPNDDGEGFTTLLSTYIPDSSDEFDLCNGLDKYFKSILLDKEATFTIISTYQKLKDYISVGKPVFVGIEDHADYENHWAVGTGFETLAGDVVVCNDGWGNVGVRINKSYFKSCAYIK